MKLDEKVKRYMDCKLISAQLKKVFDEKLNPIKEEMAQIEGDLLRFLNETGQTSAKTEYGTPYKTLATTASILDGTALFKFIKENDALDLLQRRINGAAYNQYIEDGFDVPGVKVDKRLKVIIRKS